MNELQIFQNEEFGTIRTIEQDGAPWFVGKDVADALGYTNPQKAIRDHVDEEDKGVNDSFTVNGTKAILINESGLYSLVLSSKLSNAKKFKRWVTSEVLPSIRKNGGYLAGQAELSPEELMAKALLMAQKTIAERDQRISDLSVRNQIMQPKADYFDELVDRNLLTNFRDTAKQLKIKEKAFVQYLIDHKYIYRDKHGKLAPYANKNDGLFEIKECFNEKTNWNGTQTLITPKGRETFRLLFVGQ